MTISETQNVPARVVLSSQNLREINSWEDAKALASATFGGVVTAADEMGDGFAPTDNKQQFCGRPVILIQWTFSESDFVNKETGEKGEFVVVRLMTKGGEKFTIIDGSFGIKQQLREFTDANGGRQGGLLCERGLREYSSQNDAGDEYTRYYIDTAASV